MQPDLGIHQGPNTVDFIWLVRQMDPRPTAKMCFPKLVKPAVSKRAYELAFTAAACNNQGDGYAVPL
jgi:hypothetical protein